MFHINTLYERNLKRWCGICYLYMCLINKNFVLAISNSCTFINLQEDIGRWYGYGKYTKESTVNGRWFYHSEWEWGRMGIWAASDPDYWIIGKDSVRGQSIGLAFSSKSDLCIPRDTSNWNFEAGLQNDAQIFKIQGNDIKIRCID